MAKRNKKALEIVRNEALSRLSDLESAERDDRKLGIEDHKFAQTQDGQWDDHAKKTRKGRPRYTFNQLAAAIDKIIEGQRKTDIGVEVLGLTDESKQGEIYEGLIRRIESQSSAKNIYDNAFDEALNSGRGGWRVVTQFIDDDVFEQEIRLEPIRSATSSLWFDRDAKQYDKRDAKFAYLTWTMSIDSFKSKYPKATVTDFDQDQYRNENSWFTGDNIRLAEYWRKVPINRRIAQMSDGSIYDLTKGKAVVDDLAAQGLTVLKERMVDSHRVERYIMNGAEILEGPHDWAGKYIGLIPLYGKINYIEDKEHIRGLIRFAKDASRVYNYLRSANVEITALTPKDPYWLTPTQAKGYTQQLAKMATENPAFQLFNPDKDQPGIPQRSGAPQLQTAMIEQAESAKQDISATLGIAAGNTQPGFGSDLDTRSGLAIGLQEQAGKDGAFVFSDNLVKSIEYSNVVIADLLPHIIDTERVERIIGKDGTEESVAINQDIIDEKTGNVVKLNDLGVGRYEIKATTGPMHETQRQKAAEILTDLATNNEMFAEFTPDLIAQSLSTPMAKELHKRIRKAMIAQGRVEPNAEEAEEFDTEKVKRDAIIQELTPQIRDQLKTEADLRLLDAEAAKREAEAAQIGQKTEASTEQAVADANKSELDANKSANEALGVFLENLQTQIDMGIPLTEAAHALRVGQNDLILMSQQEILPGPNSEQLRQRQEVLTQLLQNQPL